jgi:hypothetical protein
LTKNSRKKKKGKIKCSIKTRVEWRRRKDLNL